jgi:hypothetical protein
MIARGGPAYNLNLTMRCSRTADESKIYNTATIASRKVSSSVLGGRRRLEQPMDLSAIVSTVFSTSSVTWVDLIPTPAATHPEPFHVEKSMVAHGLWRIGLVQAQYMNVANFL